MTGGTVVILGPVGDNFGAGMSGGMAYVYDPDAKFERAVNPDMVVWQRFGTEHWEQDCKSLIEDHARMTGSEFSKKLLLEWELERGHFWQIIPKEMLSRLDQPLSEAAE